MFFDISGSFSVEFGRRRKTQLPDGLELEEIEIEADSEVADEKPKLKLGFQRNEEPESEEDDEE